MMEIWGGIDAFKDADPAAIAERAGEQKLLNGPKLETDDRPRLAGRHRRPVRLNVRPDKARSTRPAHREEAGQRDERERQAASPSAAASETRSATNAITSGAPDCMISHGPAMRPTMRP